MQPKTPTQSAALLPHLIADYDRLLRQLTLHSYRDKEHRKIAVKHALDYRRLINQIRQQIA